MEALASPYRHHFLRLVAQKGVAGRGSVGARPVAPDEQDHVGRIVGEEPIGRLARLQASLGRDVPVDVAADRVDRGHPSLAVAQRAVGPRDPSHGPVGQTNLILDLDLPSVAADGGQMLGERRALGLGNEVEQVAAHQFVRVRAVKPRIGVVDEGERALRGGEADEFRLVLDQSPVVRLALDEPPLREFAGGHVGDDRRRGEAAVGRRFAQDRGHQHVEQPAVPADHLIFIVLGVPAPGQFGQHLRDRAPARFGRQEVERRSSEHFLARIAGPGEPDVGHGDDAAFGVDRVHHRRRRIQTALPARPQGQARGGFLLGLVRKLHLPAGSVSRPLRRTPIDTLPSFCLAKD
jgi:hypothetical protein